MLLRKKDVIGMCHMLELPGDPNFNTNLGLNRIIDQAKKDLEILQQNGIKRILFSNEFSYPYTSKLEPITVYSMAYIIGVLKRELSVPFGVDCMYDPYSTVDLANATNADFYRITLTNSSPNDYMLGETNIGNIIRHAKNYKYSLESKLLLNISIPLRNALNSKILDQLLVSIIKQIEPYAICISANDFDYLLTIMSADDLKIKIKKSLLYCDGGCKLSNIRTISKIVDGLIIGTSFKVNGILDNPVDKNNVAEIMQQLYESKTMEK